MDYVIQTMLHRAVHDLDRTNWIYKTRQSSEDVMKPEFFKPAIDKFEIFDIIEVLVDNDDERLYLKFIVCDVDKTEKTIRLELMEEYDLLK